MIGVTSLKSDTVSLIDPSFRQQTAIKVGSQPMDMAFRGDELFVACQGDGSVHVIDIPARRVKHELPRRQGLRVAGLFLSSRIGGAGSGEQLWRRSGHERRALSGRRDPAAAAGVGPRHVRLRDDPFRQSQPGPRLGPVDGPRARAHLRSLGEPARHASCSMAPSRSITAWRSGRCGGAARSMPAAEAAQLVLGFCIPFLLTEHVAQTRVADTFFGADYGYYVAVLYAYFVPIPLRGGLQLIGARGRLDPRHDRAALLAASEAVVSALAADALRRSRC